MEIKDNNGLLEPQNLYLNAAGFRNEMAKRGFSEGIQYAVIPPGKVYYTFKEDKPLILEVLKKYLTNVRPLSVTASLNLFK